MMLGRPHLPRCGRGGRSCASGSSGRPRHALPGPRRLRRDVAGRADGAGAGRQPPGAPIDAPDARGPVRRPAPAAPLQLDPAGVEAGDRRSAADDQAIKDLWAAFTSTSTRPQPPAPRELPGPQPSARRLLGLSDRRPGLLRLAHSPRPLGPRAGVPAVHPAARAVGGGAGPHPVPRLSLLASRDELRLRGRLPGLALGPGEPVVPRHRGDGHLGGHGLRRRRSCG